MAAQDRTLVFQRRNIVTASLRCHESVQTEGDTAAGRSLQLDYSKVRAYWRHAKPSILGPYMMDGFGFPAAAGRFRLYDRAAQSVTRTGDGQHGDVALRGHADVTRNVARRHRKVEVYFRDLQYIH